VVGVPQDYTEAVKWYRLAADQGNLEAQSRLGSMYESGVVGVPQDYTEAVKWYRLAADQGDAKAQFNLAQMYENGWGVPQDYITAHMWFNVSSANDGGRSSTTEKRSEIGALLTPADLSEAQRRARVCMASNYQDCD
jgi:TPR repeat protein